MSKQKVFELVLSKSGEKHNTRVEFPDLVPETCSVVAKGFSKLLYDTVKVKSSSAKEKRSKILKFLLSLNNTGPRDHIKVDDSNCSHFLNALKSVYPSNNDVTDFLRNAAKNLSKNIPKSFSEEVLLFHARKNRMQRNKTKQLELIRKFDQEKMDSCFLKCSINKSFSTYETSETLIKGLLGNIEDDSLIVGNQDTETFDYREKQIRFGYALLNVAKSEEEIQLTESILQKLMKYENLEEFELHFIEYLLFKSDDPKLKNLNISSTIANNFPFAIEKYILKICTQIVKIDTDEEQSNFFSNLENDDEFLKFKRICIEDQYLCCKIKSMIYELYSYSSYNRNILLLCNYFDTG